MSSKPTSKSSFPHLSRRDFVATSLAVPAGLAGLTASSQAVAAATGGPALDIAEWSFFWVGVDRATLPGAPSPIVNGEQMYVEYQIPAKVRHPYPIVLVHGGGGQGLDWMGTPDGRRGWATMLLEEGYRVYVVDRPGHGRSPYHPDLHGGWPPAQTLESISNLFTPQRANLPPGGPGGRGGGFGYSPNAKLHNQWPGTGAVGSPELTQLVASQGGSFGNGMGLIKDSQVSVWQKNGAEMLDKIGPAIIMTHSAGGPFGFYVLEARPTLVKGIVVVEGAQGSAVFGPNRWGLINLPVELDPTESDPAKVRMKQVQPTEADAKLGIQPYNIQEEPAHKLKNWRDCAICIYTSEASFITPNPGAVAFLKQAGVRAEEIRLADLGIHGNGHLMMGEKNNRETLKPILSWLDKNVNGRAPLPKTAPKKKSDDATAMKLADQGYFWVGMEEKKVVVNNAPGTILVGQTFVQYLKPEQKRHRFPVVLIHGGAGQGTHYMGIGGNAGWAHYFVQAGYDTYIMDRVGHGRAIYHPDALGPIGPVFNYASITVDFKRAAVEPNRRWVGTGDVGDPLIDQFQAGQNSTPTDNALAQKLWARAGGQLLDKIGPAIIMVHSAGGPASWLIANERPGMVKAILNVEGASPLRPGVWPLTAIPLVYDPPVSDPSQFVMKDGLQADGSVKKLKNLQGIPIAYIVAERSTRRAEPVVAFLKQAGCDAEALNLKGKGIFGNGHFMMLESNRKVVFEAIRGWLEAKVPPKA
jgi:pimeloyl-ACP methyl ester carboxylesterase